MPNADETLLTIQQGGISWWVNQKDLDLLKKEIIPNLFPTESISSLYLLKETDTRLIFRVDAGTPLIIKVFKRPRLKDKLKNVFRFARSYKEWRIGHELAKQSISAPPLVALGISRRFGLLTRDLIISREIIGAKPVVAWVEENVLPRKMSFLEERVVIHDLGLFVRQIHDQGIYSTDFHLGNILIQAAKDKRPLFYLTDLHSLRKKRALTLRERIKTLTQLNDFRIPINDRMRFIKAYLKEGPLQGISPKHFVREIASFSYARWQHLWKKRKKKCLRPGKRLEALSSGSWKGMICKEYNSEDFSQLLEALNSHLRAPGTTKINEDSGILVKEVGITIESKPVNLVVKFYKTTSFFTKCKEIFRCSRAKRAWINADNLLMRGIPTAKPVAFGERKQRGIIQDCFFVTEKIPEAKASDSFLKELLDHATDSEKSSLKKDFFIRLARMLRWMHQTGICHGDLKASNMLVMLTKGKPSLFLVDMDGVKIRNNIGWREVAKDLSRVKAAFAGIISANDQEFFMEIYRRGNRCFQ